MITVFLHRNIIILQCLVPNEIFLVSMTTVSKNLSERRYNKSDMSPVSLRSPLHGGKTQNRVSQVLQVQVPLYPLRKKSTAKDIHTAHSESLELLLSSRVGNYPLTFTRFPEIPVEDPLVRNSIRRYAIQFKDNRV